MTSDARTAFWMDSAGSSQLADAVQGGGREDAHNDAVTEPLQATDQRLEVRRSNVDIHAIAQRTDQAVQLLRELGCGEPKTLKPPQQRGRRELTQQLALRERGERSTDLEVRIERHRQAFFHDEHLREQRKVRREPQVVAPRDLQEIRDRLAERDLTDAPPRVTLQQGGEIAA